ncbi:hypothetical protein GE300_00610 [Rhodobacteraceae bacterium 2CG4]|uniref:Glycerophosphoryl diester phosphodiesterase membrane domain-containing protein n=1 Tax=Halovulum marinum TaxID=2662447 RepID=A0A6L5YUV1_9RHOB|nr:hypothetical protein [Halovulum marinum]MSU88113.1 hypothetical protein [Halovulum marinum]
MADAPFRPPLGIGRLVTSTFGLLLRHAPLFLAISLIPSVGQAALQLFAYPTDFGDIAAGEPATLYLTRVFAVIGISLIISLLTMGAITMAAYDVRLGNPVRVGRYLTRTLGAAPAIVVLGLLLYVAMGFGFLLLVLPGLYLMARYWVMAPAILVERAGFRGLGRAAELTQGYRWPILGAGVLMFVVVILISIGLAEALGVAAGPNAFGTTAMLSPGYTVVLLVQALTAAIQITLLSIFTALLYARLREIKEGLGMEDLAAVFA